MFYSVVIIFVTLITNCFEKNEIEKKSRHLQHSSKERKNLTLFERVYVLFCTYYFITLLTVLKKKKWNLILKKISPFAALFEINVLFCTYYVITLLTVLKKKWNLILRKKSHHLQPSSKELPPLRR